MKTEKQKEKLLEELARNPIVVWACKRTGISRATYYRLMSEDTQFHRKAKDSIEKGVHFVNDLAEATVISLIKDRDFPATKYWLSHRHPAYGMNVTLSPPERPSGQLTPEESRLIAKAIQRDFGPVSTAPETVREIKTNRLSETLTYCISLNH